MTGIPCIIQMRTRASICSLRVRLFALIVTLHYREWCEMCARLYRYAEFSLESRIVIESSLVGDCIATRDGEIF